MNDLLEQVDSYLDGTVSVVRLNEQGVEHDALIRAVSKAGLTLSSLFPDINYTMPDYTLGVHPTIHHDQQARQRDPISSEFILHFDGSCEPIRPIGTLLVAREASLDEAPTRYVSTAGLLELATSLDIFRNFDPTKVDALFGYSAYYSQTQEYFFGLKPDDKRLQEVRRQDLARFDVASLEDLIEKLDKDPLKGIRRLPLIARHPISGEDCIMVDAGVRHIGLVAVQGYETKVDQKDLDDAFINLRLLLADADRLEAEGLTAMIKPRTGFGVAFTQVALHNQMPPRDNEAQQTARSMSVLGLVTVGNI